MIQVGIIIPETKVKGDGTSTSVTLSLAEAPFPVKPPGKVVDILLGIHPFDGDTVSFNTKTLTVTFEQTFSDVKGVSFTIYYDPT